MWLTGCALVSPAMAVSQRKSQKSGSCSVHAPACLNGFQSTMGSQRGSSDNVEGMSQQKINELSSDRTSKQAKTKHFLFPCPFL